jgi:glycine betaine/choline ABC-type transport system substrate-binding protein
VESAALFCYDLIVRLKLAAKYYSVCIKLRPHLRKTALIACLLCAATFPLIAQTDKPDLPDPVKLLAKQEIVGNAAYTALTEMGFKIELDNRKGGKIITRPYEFITGTLTSNEVDKIAIIKDTPSALWQKAHYTAEVLFEIVSSNETLLTIRTSMEALSRDITGTEKWIPIESRGIIEKRILGKINNILLHTDEMPKEEKKGFWGQRPQPVDPRQPRLPSAPSW